LGGNRVRITAQLIDAATGKHIWAERYDGELNDIFELQDQVTTRVVGAIAPKLEQVEIERVKQKPTESLDAYDHYLRGMASSHQWTKESSDEALRLFYKAIELDPSFAAAYGMAAWCFVSRKANGWMVDRAQEVAEAAKLARRAIDLGADDATALGGAGYALVFVVHDLDRGAAILDSVALNPNLALTLVNCGWTKAFLGEPDQAIKHIDDARRLSPLDPMSFRALGAVALAHFVAGRYDDASAWAEKALGGFWHGRAVTDYWQCRGRSHPAGCPILSRPSCSPIPDPQCGGRIDRQAHPCLAPILRSEPTARGDPGHWSDRRDSHGR